MYQGLRAHALVAIVVVFIIGSLVINGSPTNGSNSLTAAHAEAASASAATQAGVHAPLSPSPPRQGLPPKAWEDQARAMVSQRISELGESAFVVVGAHGFAQPGELNDHNFFVNLATKFPWGKILLVEANPAVAAALSKKINEHNPFMTPVADVIVSNVGVCPESSSGSSMPFYAITAKTATGDKRLPGFTDQFGSFNRQHVDRYLPDIVSYMDKKYNKYGGHNWTLEAVKKTVVKQDVPCYSLNQEMKRRNIQKPGVLLIDTEGFDCGIVAGLDVCAVDPWLLQYEHVHCRAQNTSQEHALANMAKGCRKGNSPFQYSAPTVMQDDTRFLRQP